MHDHQFAAEVGQLKSRTGNGVTLQVNPLSDRFDAFDCPPCNSSLWGFRKFIDDFLIDGGSFFVLIFKLLLQCNLVPSFCRLRGSRERLDERFQSRQVGRLNGCKIVAGNLVHQIIGCDTLKTRISRDARRVILQTC